MPYRYSAEMDIKDVGDTTVIRFTGREITDELYIQELGQRLLDLVIREGKRKILLNFDAVTDLSTKAYPKLLNLWRTLKKMDGTLILTGMNAEMREAFRRTAWDSLFKIYDNEAQALKEYGINGAAVQSVAGNQEAGQENGPGRRYTKSDDHGQGGGRGY